jgi:type IV pilus assembly protein PilP
MSAMAMVPQQYVVVRRVIAVLACVLALAGAAGCGEDELPAAEGRGMGSGGAAPASGAAAAAVPEKKDTTLAFKDDDFVESERNRDPFRTYTASSSAAVGVVDDVAPQRRVIMPTTDVESMRLMAVISGMPRPKAMLIDAMGVGYVVERGDYVGRGKVLQTAGTVQIVMHWRVDRIRENEVVLTRADATDPTRPPLTRIVAMRDELAAR